MIGTDSNALSEHNPLTVVGFVLTECGGRSVAGI